MFFKKKKEDVQVKVVTKEFRKMTKEDYAAFERVVGYFNVTNNTTPTESAYMLGIQFALKKLRDGYVHE